MADRFGSTAALVVVVVLAGTVAGGLAARALRSDGSAPPDDAVIAAIQTRTSVEADVAGCVLGRLVVDGVLDDDLRRRLVDATDPMADVPELLAAATACVQPDGVAPSPTSTSTSVPPAPASLAACTGEAGGELAAVEVCAVDALVALLTDGGLDPVTAACAAAAVVEELGVDAVVAGLESGVPPADLRARLQAAFETC